jgi:hypothetical protein
MKDPVKQERGKRMKRYAVEYFTDIKVSFLPFPFLGFFSFYCGR